MRKLRIYKNNFMLKNEILNKYTNLVLGQISYGENRVYTALELSNLEEAYLILGEVWSHEGNLTKNGFKFLEEYYGLNELADFLSKKGGFDEASDKVSIFNWLRELEMHTLG